MHQVALAEDGEHLELRSRHVPENVFAARRFETACWIRLEASHGDWVDVAERERARLRGRPSYRGPVGDPRHPMPAATKQALYTWTFPARARPDALDRLARELALLSAVWNPRAYVRLYGGHWPDPMGRMYDRGYLPGVPSLRAAVADGRALGAVVAPLVSASTAVDPERVRADGPERAARHGAILGAALRREDGLPLRPVAGNVVMCGGAAWWDREFEENALAVLERSGADGLYLDYFLALACFSTDHEHAPGGGSYPFERRAAQLRRIRERMREGGREIGISLEAPHSRLADEVDLVHVFPRSDVFGLESSQSVPFFRWVRDDVRVSSHPNQRYALGSFAEPLAPWRLATAVLQYGQIPVRPATDEELGADLFALGARPAVEYFGRMADLLGERGFLRWHNGSMVRPPRLEVQGGEELERRVRAGTSPQELPGFFDAALVGGMFRAWDGSFAYALTNPWLEREGALEFRARVDPAAIEGFPARFRHGELGAAARTAHEGPLELEGALAPGEIRAWVFEAEAEVAGPR